MAKRKSRGGGAGPLVTVNASGRKSPARRSRAPRRGRSRLRRAASAYGRAPRWKQRATIGAASAVMGYLSQMAPKPGESKNIYASVPTVAGLPVEVTIAVGAHMLAKGRGGLADDISTAAAAIAGYKLGRANFDMDAIQVADISDLAGDDEFADMSDLADAIDYE